MVTRPTMFIEREGVVIRVTQFLKEEFEDFSGLKMFSNGVLLCDLSVNDLGVEVYSNPKPSAVTTASPIGNILFSGWEPASREIIEKRDIRYGWWADDFKKRNP